MPMNARIPLAPRFLSNTKFSFIGLARLAALQFPIRGFALRMDTITCRLRTSVLAPSV